MNMTDILLQDFKYYSADSIMIMQLYVSFLSSAGFIRHKLIIKRMISWIGFYPIWCEIYLEWMPLAQI